MKPIRSITQKLLFEGVGSHVYSALIPQFTQQLHQWVIDEVGATLTSGTVLDIGTGPGQLVLRLAQQHAQLSVGGVDISIDMIKRARANARHARMADRVRFDVNTAATIPYPDKSVDLVVATLSLHHWENSMGMLHELARIVRPGGQIWTYNMRVPRPPFDRVRQAIQVLPLDDMQITRLPLQIGLLPVPDILKCSLRRVED